MLKRYLVYLYVRWCVSYQQILFFADGTVDIHGTYSIHVGGYDWGSATDNKKAENNPSQAIKTGDTAHGEIYAMIMMFAAAGYVFFKQRKGA